MARTERTLTLLHLSQHNLFSLQEVEREAPNNVFVIIIFGALGAVLQVISNVSPARDTFRLRSNDQFLTVIRDTQVAAFVMARRLARRAAFPDEAPDKEKEAEVCRAARTDTDSDSGDAAGAPPPGWRKKANLRMYTILDKIF